ncbi:putative C2H2-like zinc finger protein [Quillaja saponaria]|uniref:C2H2-like zinc finger protein n=1 Tax=Quillaja saponaria TaxID=32244 RepID=A0AAD7M793_QUISA|nr:putative C2H2-like zinc finger protein [Quillaja saponaria]
MPVAKLKASNSPDLMKAEESNGSLDTIIRQAIGKEPLLSFPRAGDSPVQWIQLLHALDQQEVPGWPLLSPLKVQLQKCDKCSREFCSPINYRRHIRVHHRLKKLDKDSTKNRDLLRAYWDKLSLEEAKEVVSFKNVMLEEVSGCSIIKALTNLIRKPGFYALPQYYMRAGSALLDIIQARSSRFPLSSQEFFSILDDASEKTFLCGTAVLMQKYVFDGEAGKIGLETKNLVACTSFLVEQKLVKAWIDDKDAEALRCQKLLVEEEEAAQKRQAELVERKRQKKLRQKEQKAKEQGHEDNTGVKESISSTIEAVLSVEASALLVTHNFEADSPYTSADLIPSSLEPFHPNSDDGLDCESLSRIPGGYTDSSTDHNIEHRTAQGDARRQIVITRRQVQPKSRRSVFTHGFHANENSHMSKPKHGTLQDPKAAPAVNANKVWSRKPKPEIDGVVLKARLRKEPIVQPDPIKNREVLIGSISVTLRNCSHEEGSLACTRDDCLLENVPKQKFVQEKTAKLDSIQNGTKRLIWRPVSQHRTEGLISVHKGSREADLDAIGGQGDGQTLSCESCLRSCEVDNNDNSSIGNSAILLEDSLVPGSLRLSSHSAKSFLVQRWKEAMSSNHVTLVLSPDFQPPGCQEMQGCYQSSNFDTCSTFASADNVTATAGAAKSKFRMKPEKGHPVLPAK